MKKLLILLLVIPSLSIASTTSSWELFSGPRDKWLSSKTMARMAIPHGWLLHSVVAINGSISQTTTFIPDENHEWVLDESLTKAFSKPD